MIKEIEKIVYSAIGEGSMCWENVSNAGIFESTKAAEIGERTSKQLLLWHLEELPSKDVYRVLRQRIRLIRYRKSFRK
jgi:hypothetical protein